MTMLSGWCMSAPGAIAPHRWCRFEGCSCSCHAENLAQPKGSERFAAVELQRSGPRPDVAAPGSSRGLADTVRSVD